MTTTQPSRDGWVGMDCGFGESALDVVELSDQLETRLEHGR